MLSQTSKGNFVQEEYLWKSQHAETSTRTFYSTHNSVLFLFAFQAAPSKPCLTSRSPHSGIERPSTAFPAGPPQLSTQQPPPSSSSSCALHRPWRPEGTACVSYYHIIFPSPPFPLSALICVCPAPCVCAAQSRRGRRKGCFVEDER